MVLAVAYLRAAPQFDPDGELLLGSFVLRRFGSDEAQHLAVALRRRDVFSRHGAHRDFYVRRAREFAGKPVLLAGTQQAHRDAESLRREADAVEALLVLATTFEMKRSKLHRRLAGHALRDPAPDLYLSGYAGRPASKARRGREGAPLKVGPTQARRYSRLGFPIVAAAAMNPSFAGMRVRTVVNWLLSSRLDPEVGSSFIKTGTAAEILVAGGQKRGVTKTISERVALLLARNRAEFEALKRHLAALYGVRCDFAHGRHVGGPTVRQEAQIEAFDRLVTLAVASFALNCGAPATAATAAAVGAWLAGTAIPIRVPFRPTFLANALRIL